MIQKTTRTWAAAALTAALLAACGGSDPDVAGSGEPAGAPTTKGNFTAIVSFGDSLSDLGSYAPATSLTGNGQPPYFGGKFTVNSATSTVWVENLATALGVVVTPAEVGFAGVSQKCPVALQVPALAASCTAYGQGGARITDPNGIGKDIGALTVPLKTQIANHLARFASFKASDLIVVLAGNNEGFIQLGTFAAAAAQIQADAAAGRITADVANTRLFQAQTAAQAEMKKAAQELAGYIRSEILAKGGRYVAVLTPLDVALTPFGAALPAGVRSVATGLTDTFNLWLRDGLTNQPVRFISLDGLLRSAIANPAALGFSNVTTAACDEAKIAAITGGQITDGNPLFCNGTPGAPYNSLRDGASATTWLFADDVHPTPGGHKGFSDYVQAQLRAFGWI